MGKVRSILDHHVTPMVFYGGLGLIQLGYGLEHNLGPWWHGALVIGAAMASWTLIEYLVHRFVFHWTLDWKPLNHLFDVVHRIHHRKPQEVQYVTAPFYYSLPIYGLILGSAYLVTQNIPDMLVFTGVIALSYVFYEWCHYAAHHVTPRTRVGKYLKKYHLLHHYKDSEKYFGVTSSFWDWVFGTRPLFDPQQTHRILPIDAMKQTNS